MKVEGRCVVTYLHICVLKSITDSSWMMMRIHVVDSNFSMIINGHLILIVDICLRSRGVSVDQLLGSVSTDLISSSSQVALLYVVEVCQLINY